LSRSDARGERLAGIAQRETVETLGAGETEAPCARRILLDQAHDLARRGAARSDHQIKIVIDRERQHAGGGGLDQALVIERALAAGDTVERFEFNAERVAQRAQIGFLAQFAGGDQHAVGADAQRSGSVLGVVDYFGGQQQPHAVDFRTAAGMACTAAGKFSGPGIDRRASGKHATRCPRATDGRCGLNSHTPHPPVHFSTGC